MHKATYQAVIRVAAERGEESKFKNDKSTHDDTKSQLPALSNIRIVHKFFRSPDSVYLFSTIYMNYMSHFIGISNYPITFS